MTEASESAQNLVANAKGGKVALESLEASSKASAIGMQLFTTAANMAAVALVSWGISWFVSELNNLAHAEENARKHSAELTSAYETEKKNIDDTITKYKELSEKLNDTSLSTSEVRSIKEQLLSVQDQLNEKYGAEATQIDLVNGKYDEQIRKLDKIAKKKAGNYVAENYSDIKKDQKYVSEKFNVNKSLGFKGSQASPDDYSNAGFDFKKYLDKYDKLSAEVVNPDGQYGMIGDFNLVTSGTRQEVYDQISSLLQDLKRDFGEANPDVNALKTTLSDILTDSFDTDELYAANDRIKKYAQAEILSNDKASSSYNNLVDAVDNYKTALSSGEGVDSAKKNLLETKQAAEESTKDITNSEKVLQDVYDSLGDEAPIELQIEFGKNVDEDLIASYEDTINRFENSDKVKDFFDTEGINTQSEIDAFNDITKGITDADEAIQKWNEHKKECNNIKISYSSAFESINDSLSSLTDNAELLSKVNKEISNTGIISADNLKKINEAFPEDKYPDMTKALVQYQKGLITTQELFDELEKCYDQDKTEYIKALTKKSLMDTEFLDTMKTNYPLLFNELQGLYGEDLSGWKSLEQAKLDISAETVSQIAKLYQEFYKAMGVDNYVEFNGQVVKKAIANGNTNAFAASTLSKMYSQDKFEKVISDSNVKMNGKDVNSEYQKLQDNISNVLSSAEKMKGALDNYDNDVFDALSGRLSNLDWSTLGDDSSSSSSSQTAEKLNWIERLINKISTAYSRLKNVVSDTTTTWLNRNNALSDSMSTLADEINAQSQAYEYYMNAFNSYGLDEYYKNQIADGSISIDVIYDDDLKDAISDCQDFYDKAQDAKTAVQELGIELKGLANSRFDNVASEFEEKINKIVAVRDLYSKEDELMNEKGWFSSTLLNSAMIDQENKNLQKLEAERDALVNALNSAVNSGSIMPESEDWYSMQSAIDEVSSSILDAKKALVEYDNTIRQINWDAFDRTRDDVENLITETDFLTELLKDVGITDDNGNMTKEGQAAQALLAQKYQLYLNQAKAYKDEIAKIDADLANNPYDKELLDRKQDLIDKEQEAIKSAMSEKDAIKDLTNDAYSDFIDKLGDAIDKYKELMSTMKDAYDYEKSIREKTEALNALEKQYSAYQGDNSEEGKKNIQQLKDQINSAKDDLKDTEYEKLISDTEKILDQLKDNTQEWLDQRLDQLDNLIQDIIDQSNNNASDIAETITSTAENYGYKLSESMASIWSTNTGNITKVLDNFSTSFIDSNSKIKDVCDNINSAVQGLLANSNAEAQRVADEIARQQAEQNASSDGGYSGGNDYSDDDWSGNWDTGSDDNDSSGSDGVDWIYSKDYFDKNSLNIDTSIVDRLKLHDYDSSFAARSQYYDQMGGEGQYYATYDQNVWMLDWMKSHGYRKGTKSAISGLHIYDEDDPGSEVLVTKYGVLRQFDSGDTVFNKDQVEKLWNLSKGITTPNMYMDNLGAKLPDISNMSNNLSNKVDVQFGDVTLSLPNVRNYEDFMKEAQKDPKFEKMIQNMTLGQTLGRNSLNKLTFR